jgi:hypothetical protein
MPNYKMERERYIVYVDVRKFEHENLLGCNIMLMEPNRFDMLAAQRGIHINEVHLFFDFYPWILVEINRPNKSYSSRRLLLQAVV